MEPKPNEQYAVVTPGAAADGVSGTMLKDLVNLSGATPTHINQAVGMLCEIGRLLCEKKELEQERYSLEVGDLCNGWFVKRGDGRLYCHHREGYPCPHPDHRGTGRVRKYVSDDNFDPWQKAIADYKRLDEVAGELSYINRRLLDHKRYLQKWS